MPTILIKRRIIRKIYSHSGQSILPEKLQAPQYHIPSLHSQSMTVGQVFDFPDPQHVVQRDGRLLLCVGLKRGERYPWPWQRLHFSKPVPSHLVHMMLPLPSQSLQVIFTVPLQISHVRKPQSAHLAQLYLGKSVVSLSRILSTVFLKSGMQEDKKEAIKNIKAIVDINFVFITI